LARVTYFEEGELLVACMKTDSTEAE